MLAEPGRALLLLLPALCANSCCGLRWEGAAPARALCDATGSTPAPRRAFASAATLPRLLAVFAGAAARGPGAVAAASWATGGGTPATAGAPSSPLPCTRTLNLRVPSPSSPPLLPLPPAGRARGWGDVGDRQRARGAVAAPPLLLLSPRAARSVSRRMWYRRAMSATVGRAKEAPPAATSASAAIMSHSTASAKSSACKALAAAAAATARGERGGPAAAGLPGTSAASRGATPRPGGMTRYAIRSVRAAAVN